MDFKDFFAGKDDENRRLDRVIRIFSPDLSISEIYKAIRKKLIRVNDKKTEESYHVQINDKISMASFLVKSKKKSEYKNKSNINPELPPIVFKNNNVIIFNKPANIAVHGNNSLEEQVRLYFNSSNKKTESLSFRPGPLHRIDRNTSGLVAFSWSIEGARWFTEHIQDHSIQKYYYGIVQGNLKSQEKWKDYIKKTDEPGKASAFKTVEFIKGDSDFKNSDFSDEKAAETDVTPLSWGKLKFEKKEIEITLVKFKIYTGRQHQIRSQSKGHNHPLIGDTAYGGIDLSDTEYHSKNFFLHAAELHIPENPVNLPAVIKAPLPEKFIDFLSKTCDITNLNI